MNRWLTIVGIGEDGLDSLGRRARQAIDEADVLIGGQRHLAKVEGGEALKVAWGKDFGHGVDAIQAHEGKRVVVLASGDPMNFGVGATLARRFGIEAQEVMPAPGAFSLAAARMGWSLPDVRCLTIHGRPVEAVNRHIAPGVRLLVLSRDGGSPAELARLLVERDYADSPMTVLEHMGGPDENRIETSAARLTEKSFADLNTVAVECRAGDGAVFWSRAPGLPEAAYEHDGQITKREVRAATIAALAPMPGEVLWDVGAGSGAVAIEWMRAEPTAKAVAVERDPERAATAVRNAANLGVPGLIVVDGEAPEALGRIEHAPDAVFVGGGVSRPDVLAACWDAVPGGGRLVANAVTLEAQRALLAFRDETGSEVTRLAIARSDPVGKLSALRPFMEVLQVRAVKP